MLPIRNGTIIKSPPSVSKIKIKSSKSRIQVHRLSFDQTSKLVPDVHRQDDDNKIHNEDKITQAWNKLKFNALSKAVAIATDIGPCSIGPNSVPNSSLNCDEFDSGNIEQLNLSEAVTSTPLKPKVMKSKTEEELLGDSLVEEDSNKYPLDISVAENHNSCDEYGEIEALRKLCLNQIEEQVKRCVQKKKDDVLKAWSENEEKTKEKLRAYKMELDQQHQLRLQEQNKHVKKLFLEYKANAQHQVIQPKQIKGDRDKKIAETNEKIKFIEQQRRELEEKVRQKQEEFKHCINGVYEMQVAYGHVYNQINEITKKCRDIRMLNERVMKELSQLKQMNEKIHKLVVKTQEGKVTLKDLKTAEACYQQILAIGEVFARHTDEINQSLTRVEEANKKEQQDMELKMKHEAERQQKSQEQKKNVEKETPKTSYPVKSASGIEDCVSRECFMWHLELQTYLEEFEKSLQPLLTDDTLKKFRFDCQKVVNVPVNAISPLDDLHLQDKLHKLTRMLQGQAVPMGEISLFLPKGHPLGVAFCTNLLAKKLVKQGEHVVSSKPEAAFAIAAVIVALWIDFPDFGRLLLAHFHRECPYLIPAFLPQFEGQNNEDYYRMLGYQYSEDGKVESQDKFLRRMSGVVRLYTAILVTPLKRSHAAEGKQHPLGMKEAWRWFTASLNLSPRSDISSTLLFDFLEVAGHMLYKTYGSQFTKLLQTLCVDYFPLIEEGTPSGCEGPVVRLKSFLEKILKKGKVPSPTGMLPSNFW